MKLSERLATLELSLSQIYTEFSDLTEQVAKLEEENERLRAQLPPEAITEAKGFGRGQEALATLYREGYHICPEYYGKEHEGAGCLFCEEVLRHVTN